MILILLNSLFVMNVLWRLWYECSQLPTAAPSPMLSRPPDLLQFTLIISPGHRSTKSYRSLENLVGHWKEKPAVSPGEQGRRCKKKGLCFITIFGKDSLGSNHSSVHPSVHPSLAKRACVVVHTCDAHHPTDRPPATFAVFSGLVPVYLPSVVEMAMLLPIPGVCALCLN